MDTAKEPEIAALPDRVVIEHLSPELDGGRFPVKRILGRSTTIEADCFADGHDHLTAVVRWRRVVDRSWATLPMTPLGNDRFTATITPADLGRHEYEVRARVDEYRSWLETYATRTAAGADTTSERAVGAALLASAAGLARGSSSTALAAASDALGAGDDVFISDLHDLGPIVDATVPTTAWAASGRRGIVVDRPKAQSSSWYELFPRSAGFGGKPGTLVDVTARLGYVSELGFDVLYLPPIHPIGTTNRKGPLGRPASERDPGSPWAIGGPAGGHTAIHPDLGTIDDFDALAAAAGAAGIEIALDYALQCSPDHPWVTEHPEWFRHRPDGTIACAENPPKRYEDVYPLDFGCADWRGLWGACRAILEYWIDHGVVIFRVDNPHTKPFRFWEWVIEEIHRDHPEVLFLAEAFTRPRVMEQLAKLGFSQSYTYFTWRRAAWELEAYYSELARAPLAEYFRPNAWPNTPDILVAPLAGGTRPAFAIRAVLAATLGANWGIYGPVFETCENVARADAEEYADSDKFAIRSYAFDLTAGVAPLVARLNAIRRSEPALAFDRSIRFHRSANPEIVAYSKRPEFADGGESGVLVIVNLDPRYRQTGWVTLDAEALGFPAGSTLELADQLNGERYRWSPGENFVALDPAKSPAHIFTVRWSS